MGMQTGYKRCSCRDVQTGLKRKRQQKRGAKEVLGKDEGNGERFPSLEKNRRLEDS